MILITQNDFTERTGVDLSADLREDGITTDRQATALIERWERYVYKTASRFPNCINDANLNEAQIEDIKNAVCDYGLACILKGDLESMGGEDLTNATNEIPKNSDCLTIYAVLYAYGFVAKYILSIPNNTSAIIEKSIHLSISLNFFLSILN